MVAELAVATTAKIVAITTNTVVTKCIVAHPVLALHQHY